ncbi:hypothetical protein P7H44_07750 [Vagococcus lutrae]|nr:hypothetical protein [Vagococcus lutrae]MDT2842622.1 hypothetical protein [Vagococcus lutrae]
MDDKKTVNKGLSFLNILTLVFVIAKLLGLVTFSWWLVFLPTLIQLAFALLMLVVVLIVAVAEDS